MPLYRDPITRKWKFDGMNFVVTLLIIISSIAGSYYANRAVTAYRLDRCEAEASKCRTDIKDVGDRLTNHAMGESGTQARLAAVESTVGKIDNKLDMLIPLAKATRDSQRARGY